MLKGAAAMVLAAADATSALLHAQDQPHPPPISDTQITVSTIDVIIGRNSLLARVPIGLSVPAPHTMVVEYWVQERPGTTLSTTKLAASPGHLIFHPGEQHKVIELQLGRPLGPDQTIDLRLADFGYPVRAYATRTARITSGDVPTSLALTIDTIPLPSLPSGGSIAFADDLRQPDFASDSGFRPDGRACWQSRLARTRQQIGNKEAGYYADPALNPEAKVWGIDPFTGCRYIQAEYLAGGLSDGNGGKLVHAWEKDVPFAYSAAMITSRTLFNRITIGSYVEFEVKLARVAGSWPALWLLRADDAWPPEIDVIEAFISSPTHAADVITSSIHWRGGEKGHETYGTSVPLRRVEPEADIFERFNRFGCLIGEKQIVYYFNRKPYCAMPNLVGAGPWFMLLDVAVGGLVGEPRDPTAFPARMLVAGVKVVQFC
ncbi:glycoside hydrolase family 16 protein [Bradyrhizobium sp. USDA 4474]